jgi:hypothetical protein
MLGGTKWYLKAFHQIAVLESFLGDIFFEPPQWKIVMSSLL